MLKNRLPPLDPLVAFEAAARLLSFTRAGQELHLSQAAVSQQIRLLERRLQVKLFNRLHRAVSLTNKGREYQHTVSAVLKHLAGATSDIKTVEEHSSLSFACDLSFAHLWLAARLPQFQELNPQLAFRLTTSDNDDDCTADDIQVSVLHGDGYWPGFDSHLLFKEEVFPVCSPDYDNGTDPGDWQSWLLNANLIDLEDSHWNWMNWRSWLAGNNINDVLPFRNLQINNYPLLIDAACRGQGVALGWSNLVADRLASGALIRPIEQSFGTSFGYYLIVNNRYAQEAPVTLFRDWLIAAFETKAI